MVRHHHRVAPAIALTLALVAAAPAAARFDLNPATGAGNSAGGNVANESGATLPHDPRARAVALAGAGYTYGYTYGTTPRHVAVVAGARHVTPTTLAASAAISTTHATASGVHHVSPTAAAAPSNGFDWGDAGIGAGGAIALLGLGAGGALGLSSIRRRTTRSTA